MSEKTKAVPSSPLLYVTTDGLLEPLIHSQVVRVVEALAARGHRYAILSLEKPKDLERTQAVAALRRRLDRAGIEWFARPYDWSQSAGAAARNVGTLVGETLRLARQGRIRGVHARAYTSAFAALAAFTAHKTPFLFDARSYWIDERLEDGRWFTSPVRLAVARGLERRFFADAAGVVTLTELQAEDVRGGRFGPTFDKPVTCIPTCADYADFVRRPLDACQRVPKDVRDRLGGTLTLGIIGSLNRSYLVPETLELVRRVFELRDDARLLVLSAQKDEYQAELSRRGVDLSRVVITRAEHDAMPEWLSLLDWGMLLLDEKSAAKRASMPTKLAEFFAAGVRPVQFGCNEEVAAWVKRAGSGLVLDGVSPEHLAAAARAVASRRRDEAALAKARELTQPHFSLASGIERYDAVLRRAFGTP